MGVKVDPAKPKPLRPPCRERPSESVGSGSRARWCGESEPDTNAGPTSGVLATAGNLVFKGNGGGKILSAYDAKTGKKLWNFDAKTAVFAAPIVSTSSTASSTSQPAWVA